mgnify:CR=1 FL=1
MSTEEVRISVGIVDDHQHVAVGFQADILEKAQCEE